MALPTRAPFAFYYVSSIFYFNLRENCKTRWSAARQIASNPGGFGHFAKPGGACEFAKPGGAQFSNKTRCLVPSYLQNPVICTSRPISSANDGRITYVRTSTSQLPVGL